MKADTFLRKMRIEGAYHRAQHFGRLLAAAAEKADGSEASWENIHRLQANLTEATEAAVWLESLKRRGAPPKPAVLTDLCGHVSGSLMRRE